MIIKITEEHIENGKKNWREGPISLAIKEQLKPTGRVEVCFHTAYIYNDKGEIVASHYLPYRARKLIDDIYEGFTVYPLEFEVEL